MLCGRGGGYGEPYEIRLILMFFFSACFYSCSLSFNACRDLGLKGALPNHRFHSGKFFF